MKLFYIFLIGLIGGCNAQAEEFPAIWQKIADASVILYCNISYHVETHDLNPVPGLTLEMSNVEVCKGTVGSTPLVIFCGRNGQTEVKDLINVVKPHLGRPVAVYLRRYSGDSPAGFEFVYPIEFCPYLIEDSSKAQIQILKKSVADVELLAKQFPLDWRLREKELFFRIQKLVDGLTDSRISQENLRQLLLLPPKAIPILISLLSDRRAVHLPEGITGPGSSFESISHYDAEEVVDVIAFVLGSISPLGTAMSEDLLLAPTKEERLRVEDAWKIAWMENALLAPMEREGR